MRWLLILLFLGIFGLPWTAAAQSAGYSADELDGLVGPIALYPDPLLSSTTMAATQPEQIQDAAQALKSGFQAADSSWDSSVRALYAYPEVLKMMAENQDWTKAIGWAAANQPTELMDAVQRFRFAAKSAGNLKSNDKMLVIEEGTIIRIEPANPEIVYVPTYPADEVTVDNGGDGSGLWGFAAGVATSALLYNNYYHWGNGGWCHPPAGWRPRPGWGGTYPPVATPYRPNTAINRPVNINQINTNRVRAGNLNSQVNRSTRVNNTINGGNRVAPGATPGVTQRGGGWADRPGGGERPDLPSTRPPMSDYSRSGPTTRASDRGSYSRGSRSSSSGRRGGGRRR